MAETVSMLYERHKVEKVWHAHTSKRTFCLDIFLENGFSNSVILFKDEHSVRQPENILRYNLAASAS